MEEKHKWEISEAATKETLAVREKCTKQLALNVTTKAKCHSNLQKASLFTAETVLEKDENSNHAFLDKKN